MPINFNNEITKPSNNLLIVDGLNLAFRYKHSGQKDFASSYQKTVLSLANSYGAEHIVVCGDWGSKWRKEIDPQYKANRTALKENQTEEEAQEFLEFLEELGHAFTWLEDDAKIFRFEGVEADDIAAYLVKHIPEHRFEHIWLVSSDKDWDLLVQNHVSRFSYVTRKEITVENWSDHYPYSQEAHISIKALTGDKGDNVPGIVGVGEKRAVQIIEQYGPTAFDVYDSLPLAGKQKFIQNTNEFGQQILVNYELMDLLSYCDEAVLDNKETLNNYIYGLGDF